MPTIAELINGIVREEREIACSPIALEKEKREESLKKANKVERLKRLCKEGRRIGFIVETPGTKSGRPYHSTFLMDAEVKKTEDGEYVITGIDIELSLVASLEANKKASKRAVITKKMNELCFRSYRIDRIMDGTIVYS